MNSTRLKQEDCYLTHVEIDKMLCLVGNIGAEVPAYNAVPGWVVFLVELLLDVGRNIFFDVEFFQRNVCAINRVLLHLLVHISVLDNCLSLCC